MNSRITNPVQRPMPPLNTDERTTLEAWLDFHRATLGHADLLRERIDGTTGV